MVEGKSFESFARNLNEPRDEILFFPFSFFPSPSNVLFAIRAQPRARLVVSLENVALKGTVSFSLSLPPP